MNQRGEIEGKEKGMTAKDIEDEGRLLLGLQKIYFNSSLKRGGRGLFSEIPGEKVKPNA